MFLHAEHGCWCSQVTEEQLATLFQACGRVVDCRVCGDPNSAMRFAFIEFMEEAAVQLVGCSLKPLDVMNQQLIVLAFWTLSTKSQRTLIQAPDVIVSNSLCAYLNSVYQISIRIHGDFWHCGSAPSWSYISNSAYQVLTHTDTDSWHHIPANLLCAYFKFCLATHNETLIQTLSIIFQQTEHERVSNSVYQLSTLIDTGTWLYAAANPVCADLNCVS